MKNLVNISAIFFFFLIPAVTFSTGTPITECIEESDHVESDFSCNMVYTYGDFKLYVNQCNGISGSAYYQGFWLGDFSFYDNGKGMYKTQVESTMAGVKVYVNKSNGRVSFKYGFPDPRKNFDITYSSRIKF